MLAAAKHGARRNNQTQGKRTMAKAIKFTDRSPMLKADLAKLVENYLAQFQTETDLRNGFFGLLADARVQFNGTNTTITNVRFDGMAIVLDCPLSANDDYANKPDSNGIVWNDLSLPEPKISGIRFNK